MVDPKPNARKRQQKGRRAMHTPKISRGRQLRFLAALARSGNVISAAIAAHLDRAALEEARRTDRAFANEWDMAEATAAHKLEDEAWRRAVEGVPEPLISEGKVVRDDDGRPLSIQRYSDALLIEMLRMYRLPKFRRKSLWRTALDSRRMKFLALGSLIVFVTLATGSLVLQWLESHLLIAAFH